MPRRWRVAGINFDHMHMGDNLRFAHEHPDVDVVGLYDEHPERMSGAAQAFGVPDALLHTDPDTCMRESAPDLVILCPSTGTHADWVERIAPYGKPVMMVKLFAVE